MPHWLIVCLWPLFWGGGACGCVTLAVVAFRARRRLWRAPGIIAAALAPLMMGATFSGIPYAPNNAVLKLYPSWQYFAVYRAGFYVPGDGGAATYIASSSNCTISGGDNGSQVQPTTGTGCWIASFTGPANVMVWGAYNDGTKQRDSGCRCAAAALHINRDQLTQGV